MKKHAILLSISVEIVPYSIWPYRMNLYSETIYFGSTNEG